MGRLSGVAAHVSENLYTSFNVGVRLQRLVAFSPVEFWSAGLRAGWIGGRIEHALFLSGLLGIGPMVHGGGDDGVGDGCNCFAAYPAVLGERSSGWPGCGNGRDGRVRC